MTIYKELVGLENDKLLELFFEEKSENSEEDDFGFFYYSDIAYLLFEKDGEIAIKLLFDNLSVIKDAEQLRALISVVGCSQNKDLYTEFLASFLNDQRPLIVGEAIYSLARLGAKEYFPQILDLYDGVNSPAFVKSNTLVYVRRLYPEVARDFLIKALNDTEALVRESACDELEELGDKSAIPFIVPLIKDEVANVRQAAETAVCNLQDE